MNKRLALLILALLATVALLNSYGAKLDNLNWKRSFNNDINSISVSGSGGIVAVAPNNLLYILDGYGDQLYYSNLTYKISSIKISNDSNYVIVGTLGNETYFFKRDGNTFSEIQSVQTSAPVLYTAISYNGNSSISVSSDGYIVFFKSQAQISAIKNVNGKPVAVHMTGKGNRALISTNLTYFYSFLYNGSLEWTKSLSSAALFLDSTYDGSLILALAKDGSLYAFLGNGSLKWTKSFTGTPKALSVSYDASYIAAGISNRVYVLNKTGNVLWNYTFAGDVTSLSISKKGDSLVALVGNYIYYFDMKGNPLWNNSLDSAGYLLACSYNCNNILVSSAQTVYYFANKPLQIISSYITTTITKTNSTTIIKTTTKYINNTFTTTFNKTFTETLISSRTNYTTITFTFQPRLSENIPFIVALILTGIILGLGLGFLIRSRYYR